MGYDDVTIGHTPTDRLTALCEEMTSPLDRPENEDVQAIVFLHDKDRGGIVVHGYEDDETGVEAMSDLLVHIKAVFEANGKQFGLMNENGVMIL